MADAKKLIRTSSAITEREQPFSHPWNVKSELIGVQLGRALGLKRTGINIARMPPGKESFLYHSHQHEEEWLYILSGRSIAEIDVPKYQTYLREHRPPTLIVWGPQDGYMPEGSARAYLQDLPDAELHLLDGGHWALETNFDEIVTLARDFLGRVHAAR